MGLSQSPLWSFSLYRVWQGLVTGPAMWDPHEIHCTLASFWVHHWELRETECRPRRALSLSCTEQLSDSSAISTSLSEACMELCSKVSWKWSPKADDQSGLLCPAFHIGNDAISPYRARLPSTLLDLSITFFCSAEGVWREANRVALLK